MRLLVTLIAWKMVKLQDEVSVPHSEMQGVLHGKVRHNWQILEDDGRGKRQNVTEEEEADQEAD